MVADDNDLLRSIIADILQDAGYSVVEARTGKEALWHLDSYSDSSLLITDLAMPDISMDLGRSLGRILLGQAADSRFIRITGEPKRTRSKNLECIQSCRDTVTKEALSQRQRVASRSGPANSTFT